MILRESPEKTLGLPRMKKAGQSESKFEAMVIVVFDIKGVNMGNWVFVSKVSKLHMNR